MNNKQQKYIRAGTYTIDEVLPFVIFDDFLLKLKREGFKKGTPEFQQLTEKWYGEHRVKMYSQRYQLFKTKGIECVKCGIVGEFFALERHENNNDDIERFHFNLYGVNENGEETLMTKDHIHPKSKGGKNTLENYQVMCINCNSEKADKTSRKLASVQKIKEVLVHPNADKLEIVKVLGWQCVSRKGEFQPGDLCVYFEIDSLIPITEWSRFLGDKNKPDAPVRLKTIRLRGELSQGLAMPLSILGHVAETQLEGDDLTECLKIEKYEPPIPACLNGQVKGHMPSYIKKTDEDRIQAFPNLIQEFQGIKVYVTQKIDGSSGSFSVMEGKEDVCGRNWSYFEDNKNTYWKVAKKYNILPKLKEIWEKTGKNYAVQGEVVGEGIQKNRLQIKGHDLFIFNVIDLQGGKYLDFYAFKEFCERLQLKTVPILQICEFKWQSIDELLELAKGKYESGKNQEGIVIRPIVEFYSETLKGRASLKVINNEFLLDGGD